MSIHQRIEGELVSPRLEPLAEAPVGLSPTRELWRKFRKQKVAMVALVFLVLVILVAVFAKWVAPQDPDFQTPLINRSPSSAHWLGTDDVGRDILSRIIFGSRVSLRAAFQIVFMALAIALPVGLISGYFGRWVDALIMRVTDAMFAFPPLILALSVVALLGRSFSHTMLAISIAFSPGFIRLIRAQVLAVREETYIEASRSVGAGSTRMITRHVLPNVASPMIVQVALSFGYALLSEAGLSFLGLGVQPPTPSWSIMLSRAYSFILDTSWPLFPPGVAILLTVLAFNMVGDGLRDALGRETFKVER